MKTSFSATAATEPVTEPAPAKEIVPATSTALAPVQDAGNDMVGEISRNDVRLPRLNMVARTGDLAELFQPGAFVLNKEIKLAEGSGKDFITLIAVRLRKQYQESLPFGDPETPRIFDSAEEVRANGGTVAYGKGAGIFAEIAHAELLIEKPAGIPEEYDAHFFFESEGKSYAHCVYTVSGTAYNNFARPLISARFNHLRDTGLVGGLWTLTSELKKANGNAWFSPVLKTAGMTSEQFRQDVAAIL
jgi:hypothetical protein